MPKRTKSKGGWPKGSTHTLVSLDEAASVPGRICAWADCTATIEDVMPPDWRNLLVYWSPHPAVNCTLGMISMGTSCDRDAALCPQHARELESLLKDLACWADGPMGGAA